MPTLPDARADLEAQQGRTDDGDLEPRLIYRRMVARLERIDDKDAARQALAEILGQVPIERREGRPVAVIDAGQALASVAQIDNGGSGGALRLLSTAVPALIVDLG